MNIKKSAVVEVMNIIAKQNKRDVYPMVLINEVHAAINEGLDHAFKAQVLSIIQANVIKTQEKTKKEVVKYVGAKAITQLRLKLKPIGSKVFLAQLIDLDPTVLVYYLNANKRMPEQIYELCLKYLPVVLEKFDAEGVAA